MTSVRSQLRRRLPARGDDQGISLIFAMIFITVVAVAVAAVLTLSDTNLRSTLALRDQAATAAAADGAAQVAINTLRNSSYAGAAGTTCLATGNQLALNNLFTLPSSGATGSALVTCELDENLSTGGLPIGPGLTTTGAPPGGSYAIDVLSGNNQQQTLRIDGDVRSVFPAGTAIPPFCGGFGSPCPGGSLRVGAGDRLSANVSAGTTVRAAGSCSFSAGTVLPAPTCNTGLADVLDALALPPAPPSTRTWPPACTPSATVMTFQPGLYADDPGFGFPGFPGYVPARNVLPELNAAMNCQFTQVYDFRPGVYYFSFAGEWTISKGIVVAGRPAPVTSPTPAPTVPGAPAGACTPTTPSQDSGVEFVFAAAAGFFGPGTDSARLRITGTTNVFGSVTGGPQIEICGRRSAGTRIAIYGLPQNIGSFPSSALFAINGCASSDWGSSSCGLVRTDANSRLAKLYVQGMLYAPTAKVDLDLFGTGVTAAETDYVQQFNGGIVARTVAVKSPANANHAPLVSASALDGGAAAQTVTYLTVYVCPTTPTCTAATGRVAVKAMVGLAGNPTPGTRDVTVYSWSTQRTT